MHGLTRIQAFLVIAAVACSRPDEPGKARVETKPAQAAKKAPALQAAVAEETRAIVDLLASPERLEAGADPAWRFVDLARPSGLWILRDHELLGAWAAAEAGSIRGTAIGAEPLHMRINASETGGRCLKLLVGADGPASVQVGRRGGGRSSFDVEQGATLVDGPCPGQAPAVQDYNVKAKGASAVLAGIWIVPEVSEPPASAPEVAPCAGGKGISIGPGTSIRTEAAAEKGSVVRIEVSGAAASSLEVTVLGDGMPEERIALEKEAETRMTGSRAICRDRPCALGIVASLAKDSAGPVCLERAAVESDELRASPVDGRRFDAVVVIVTDTMRGDLYPHEGSDFGVPMPGIRDLASRSIVYAAGTAQSDYTKPSVATILSGLYPEQHGALGRKAPVRSDVTMLQERLEKAGVRTVSFLSNFFFNASFGMRRGWTDTHFVDPWGASLDDTIVVDEVERWTKGGVPDGPLFVYVHLMGAHAPYVAPEKVRASFLGGSSLPARLDPVGTAELIKDLTAGRQPRLDENERRLLESLYRADAAYHDEIMARLVKVLEDGGLWGRALVIYTSDHGEEFYEHGRVGHGTGLWSEQVHVPLVVHLPGREQGASVADLVGHVDIAPTVLEAFGIDMPGDLPGRSLLAAALPGPRALLLEQWTGRRGVQLGPWKLQRRPADEKISWSPAGLDEEIDPRDAPLLHALMRKHLAWGYLAAGKTGGSEAVDLPPDVAEQLEKLGYILK